MKKSTKTKIKKAAKKSVAAAERGARVAAANAVVMGRGIMRGVRQGMKDADTLNKRSKKKSRA